MLFSTVVGVMSVEAMGLRPPLCVAPEVDTSLAAPYGKVNRMEPSLGRGNEQRLKPVVKLMQAAPSPWAKGYRVRVLNGNHLPASEKRLRHLRCFLGAALPGHSLVVHAPKQGLEVGTPRTWGTWW